MGKGIIFVGSTNLNRNSDQQSMYSKKGSINNDKIKNNFYVELRSYCLQNLNTKNRKKRITSLKNKYGTYACSEKNMEKVFEAYASCFQNCKNSQIKLKKNHLPNYLNKYRVDKRIQKRLFNIEGIDTIDKVIENRKYIKINVTKSNKRNASFYSNLHFYMDKYYDDSKVPLTIEIKKGMKKMSKGDAFIDSIRELYSYRGTSSLNIGEICRAEKLNLTQKDINWLKKYWD